MLISVQLMVMASGIVLGGPGGLADTSPAASSSIATLLQQHPGARIFRDSMNGIPRVITGLRFRGPSVDPKANADAFVAKYAAVFGRPQLVRHSVHASKTLTSIHYRHTMEGLTVLERSLVVNVAPNGTVKSVNNDLGVITHVNRATVSADDAREVAMEALSRKAGSPTSLQAHSVIKRGLVLTGTIATEVIDVHVSRQPLSEHIRVRIDGVTGKVLSIQNQLIH